MMLVISSFLFALLISIFDFLLFIVIPALALVVSPLLCVLNKFVRKICVWKNSSLFTKTVDILDRVLYIEFCQ